MGRSGGKTNCGVLSLMSSTVTATTVVAESPSPSDPLAKTVSSKWFGRVSWSRATIAETKPVVASTSNLPRSLPAMMEYWTCSTEMMPLAAASSCITGTAAIEPPFADSCTVAVYLVWLKLGGMAPVTTICAEQGMVDATVPSSRSTFTVKSGTWPVAVGNSMPLSKNSTRWCAWMLLPPSFCTKMRPILGSPYTNRAVKSAGECAVKCSAIGPEGKRNVWLLPTSSMRVAGKSITTESKSLMPTLEMKDTVMAVVTLAACCPARTVQSCG